MATKRNSFYVIIPYNKVSIATVRTDDMLVVRPHGNAFIPT